MPFTKSESSTSPSDHHPALFLIHFYNPSGNLIMTLQETIESNGHFEGLFFSTGSQWSESGTYTTQVSYGSIKSENTFSFQTDESKLKPQPELPTILPPIPKWIKNSAGWWSEGLVDDSDFVNGIQWLIKNGIMKIPQTQLEVQSSEVIPPWIKNSAGWWSEGLVDDSDFVNGIQWLIKNGIMKINASLPPQPEPQPQPQPEILPVPWTEIYLNEKGKSVDEKTVLFKAYQFPQDPFRIVCQVPCPISEESIFAKYAGFKKAHERLIELIGIDVLEERKPVDIHLNSDATCGQYLPGITGFAGRSMVCIFEHEKIGIDGTPQLAPQNAITLEQQILAIHEYQHVIFFGLMSLDLHDFIVPISDYVTKRGALSIYTDPCHPILNSYGFGKLIYNLCQENGFSFDDLGPSLIMLDELYQTGQGEIENGKTSVYQYRDVLNQLLQTDTTQAFIDSNLLPPSFRGSSLVGPSGGTFSLADGYVTIVLPQDVIQQPVTLWAELIKKENPGSIQNVYFIDLRPYNQIFSQPIQIEIKYDPNDFPFAIQSVVSKKPEGFGIWDEIPGSVLNTSQQTITFQITEFGQYSIRITS